MADWTQVPDRRVLKTRTLRGLAVTGLGFGGAQDQLALARQRPPSRVPFTDTEA